MNEIHVKSALQLLEARKAALEQMTHASMKAHGKWMNKEFFSWQNAAPHQLGQTLESLPYPILWIAQLDEYELVKKKHKNALQNIQQAILVTSQESNISDDLVVLTSSYQNAFQLIKNTTIQRAVVLISLKDHQNKEYQNEIQCFLSAIAVK